MEGKPKGPGSSMRAAFLVGTVCCGPVLVASGAFSGFGVWLAGGGYVTVLLATAAGVVVVYGWRLLFRRPNFYVNSNGVAPQTNDNFGKKQHGRL